MSRVETPGAPGERAAPTPELDAAFAGRVLRRLPAADRARRRRRVMAAVRPSLAGLGLALFISLLNLSALPVHGAEGARTAAKAVSWLVVGYGVWTRFAGVYLDYLGLTLLPVVTAALLLAAIVAATFSIPRRDPLARRSPGDARLSAPLRRETK